MEKPSRNRRFFYFCIMTNINLLTEINENIVSKGFYTVDAVKIRYYYKEVYKTELKENCSSCLRDAYQMLIKYYRGNIDKANASNKQIIEARIYELKKKLIEFKRADKFELCEVIKNQIEINKAKIQ